MRPHPSRRWRAAVATSVAVSSFGALVVLGPSTGAFATGLPPAEVAPSSLEALRAEVARTGDRLAAAAVAYEHGQLRLNVLVQRKFSTGRTVEVGLALFP